MLSACVVVIPLAAKCVTRLPASVVCSVLRLPTGVAGTMLYTCWSSSGVAVLAVERH
jgi:hypothetical protein